MNKPKYAKTILCCVILTVAAWQGWAQSEPVPSKSKQSSTLDVGRDNPFAELSKKPTQGKLLRSSPLGEEMPELFVEIMVLKSLEAKSLKPVIQSMCSEYGSISADTKTNSLIICDTKENLARIIEELKKANRTPQQSLFVETITLKFLNAENLTAAITGMSSAYGSISTDVKSNSLIICDIKGNLEAILAQVRIADKTPEQILIEVVIADVVLDDNTEIGIDWNRLFETKRDQSYLQTLVPTTLSATGSIGAHFAYTKTSGSISGTLHALQQVRNVEVLANPSILVVSGEEAFIKTIEEIPYQELTDTATGGSAALTSTEFKEVGVTLTVKATVTDDGKILMTIEPEQSVATGDTGGVSGDVPNVDKRSAKTTLLMEDGEVVVMGGLKRKETTITKKMVPLLGDLPLIGFFFTDNKTQIKNTELLVFISPHIHKGEPIPDEAMAKFKKIKDRPILSIP